jgi:hypothetical protein
MLKSESSWNLVPLPALNTRRGRVSQPHFGLSVRMKLTLPKVGTWSPSRLLKTQSSSSGVKTPCIRVFFIPLERSWNLDVRNGVAWVIWTSAAQVMGKRKAHNFFWLPTTKSQESTRIRRLQEQCDMALESSQRELQDWFRPHPNRRSKKEVMDAQSPESPIRIVSGLLLGSPGKKCHLDVVSVESCREYYKGEGGGFPRVRAMVSQVSSSCPWLVPTPKGCKMSSNQLVGWFWM